jgi:bifunctional non-homologous end joining protein LigD
MRVPAPHLCGKLAGMSPAKAEVLEVAGREIRVSNPSKPYFPQAGLTKLDVVRYFADVAEVALHGCRDRPVVLHRYPDGIEGEDFYQKRLPKGAPEWVETAHITFPSGRTATMPVMADAAHLAWHATLGCVDVNPWPVRGDDVDHPDELRVDLDPIPGVPWEDVREVALVTRDVLDELGYRAFPKTSGKRGIHVNLRIEPRWSFTQVRRAALALARAVERRSPKATSAWWKEERHGVFVDYNQNARDRTVASAYSIRPVADARISTPLDWDEVAAVDPAAYTVATISERLQTVGDPGTAIDEVSYPLDALLELADRDEREGFGDAPWPPHFPKGEDEPPRVQPSRRRKTPPKSTGTGRRQSTKPLIEIARAESRDEALAGLERWKDRHAVVSEQLQPADVLVDSMRGRFKAWWRIRVNLEHVPEDQRPQQEDLEVDYDPWAEFRGDGEWPPPKRP